MKNIQNVPKSSVTISHMVHLPLSHMEQIQADALVGRKKEIWQDVLKQINVGLHQRNQTYYKMKSLMHTLPWKSNLVKYTLSTEKHTKKSRQTEWILYRCLWTFQFAGHYRFNVVQVVTVYDGQLISIFFNPFPWKTYSQFGYMILSNYKEKRWSRATKIWIDPPPIPLPLPKRVEKERGKSRKRGRTSRIADHARIWKFSAQIKCSTAR